METIKFTKTEIEELSFTLCLDTNNKRTKTAQKAFEKSRTKILNALLKLEKTQTK